MIRICIITGLTAFCMLIIALYTADYEVKWPCYLTNSVLGFAIMPLFFLSYELASQQTIKLGVGEATSCGIINMITNLLSVFVVLILTPVLKHENARSSLWSFLAITATQIVALILIFIVKN